MALRRTEHLHSRKPVERLHLEGVDRKRELVTVRVGQIDPITGFELVERGENCGTRHAIEVAVDHRLAGRAGPDARAEPGCVPDIAGNIHLPGARQSNRLDSGVDSDRRDPDASRDDRSRCRVNRQGLHCRFHREDRLSEELAVG